MVMEKEEAKSTGFTVWGFVVDTTSDYFGLPRVYKRCDTKEELDDFFKKVNSPDSGWLPEELDSLRVENSKYFNIPF